MYHAYHRIAFRSFLQTVAICLGMSLGFGALYIHLREESEFIRWSFGFLSVLSLGVTLTLHTHITLIRPLRKLRRSLLTIDVESLLSDDLVIYGPSQLQGEFAEIETLFHELLHKTQVEHREVRLTRNNLSHLNLHLAEELEIRRKQLETRVAEGVQRNKAAALGEMAAGIAHEINNPLAILVGRTEQLRELLLRDKQLDPKKEAVLNNLERTIFRIQESVLDLEFLSSSQEHEELRKIPISRLIKRINRLVSNRYQTKSIEFTAEIEADLVVEGRESELSQALISVLENAAEAAGSSEGRWVKLELIRSGDDRCLITITDSGAGVDEALREKIFQPFFSTKDEGRGMGLNLARSVIERHQGSLAFDFSLSHTAVRISLSLLALSDERKAV